ncbi:MAG: collagen-like protein [Bdellovibrionales bacterium]|nr:collagen-like protein [Bdellovibrionales bacterium]
MRHICLILSLIYLQSLAFALPSEMTFDVSGVSGKEGERGASGFTGAKPGESGADGQEGKDGSPGGNAGEISVTIGFVEKSNGQKVYIRGYLQKPGSHETQEIEKEFETASINQLTFLASGGEGGKGGDGGDGGDGSRGKQGTNGTELGFGRDGGAGGDGGSGGNGARGGRGGRGGDGGQIKITLAKGSEILAPLIKYETIAGRGGEGGLGGQSGTGGRGGRGGTAACEVFNSGIDATSHFSKCGKNGANGRDGSNGKNGRTGGNGSNGTNGRTEFIHAEGGLASRSYAVELTQLETEEEYLDGVFEDDEKVTIKAFTLINLGAKDVPAGEYKFKFFSQDERVFKEAPLEPGKRKRFVLEAPIKLSVDHIKDSVPIELRINSVLIKLKLPQGLVTEKPLELVDAQIPAMNDSRKEATITAKVKDLAKKSYGINGDLHRKVFLSLQSKNPNTVLAAKVGGEERSLKEPFSIEIESIDPGETKTVQIPFLIKGAIVVGSREILNLQLMTTTSEGKDKAIDGKDLLLKFTVDPTKAVDYGADLRNMKISCKFPKLFWSTRTLKKLTIRKPENTDRVDIGYKLKSGFSNPPIYSVHVDDIQHVLVKLFAGTEVTRDDIVELMNYAVREASQQSSDVDWQLLKCE